MEKLLNPYDKEYMKMAMLKHEETFRQQVYELHRLYRIQKMLMKSIENQVKDNRRATHQNQRPGFDLEQPAEENIAESDGDGELEIEDESSIQLTLGLTSYYQRKKAETPRTSDSGLSLSSSSTGSSHAKRTTSGPTRHVKYTTTEELRGHSWGLTMVPDSNSGFRSQDRVKQAPWLFQALGLNMT
ncbi:hypothetical protein NMG60_11005951 [Bertholletia excelsa]